MTVMKALIAGLSCSIRSRQAVVSSTGEICFQRSRSEASAIVNSVIRLLLDDVFLQGRDEGQDLTLLFLRYFELIERGGEVFGGCIPVGFSDAESRVCGLHFAPGVDTWSPSSRTKLIENMLADALFGINAVAGEELLKLLVGNESANEIVDHSGERVVTADPFV